MPEGTHGMSLNERPGISKILDPKMLTHEDATNDMPNESPLDGDIPGGHARTPAARDRSHLTWREVDPFLSEPFGLPREPPLPVREIKPLLSPPTLAFIENALAGFG